MTYLRVIPRDLFNEADLLKCLGRLWILLDGLPPGHHAGFGRCDLDYDGAPFHIEQDPADGSISVENLLFRINGNRWRLRRPLNSRAPWPLYADRHDEEVSVFTESGELTAEFRVLIGAEVFA